ncbi:MAG: alpha/beta hydrolase [Alphaproteobacteria bacterium]|nr:alpha/beta hydrolase [Alphaproteobacteria bacterium]
MLERTPSESLLRALMRGTRRLPWTVRRLLAGPAPTNDRGVSLDRDLHWMLTLRRLTGKERAPTDIHVARAQLGASARIGAPSARDVARVEELELAGRPARVFWPAAARPPMMLALHGGCWTTGDLRSHESLWRRFSHALGWAVVALDYTLAPEGPFPAGLEDCLAAWRALQARAEDLGGDASRLFIGGDSAGGNLSAAVCLATRDAGERQPDLQVLIYPAVDLRCVAESHVRFGEGFFLSTEDLSWHLGHYAAPDPTAPLASPLLAPDHRGLAPAVVATAGFDPLRDEGEAYAQALEDAGVRVWRVDAPDMIHGFANMDGISAGADRALGRLIEVAGQAADALRPPVA